MGRVLLVGRLAVRNLRRRPVEAALLVLAIMAATATLTLGLFLHEVATILFRAPGRPRPGRTSSRAPAQRRSDSPPISPGLEALTDAPGVIGHSGPYPMSGAEARGVQAARRACGRRARPAEASIDQPKLTQGSWVRRRRRGRRGWPGRCARCRRRGSDHRERPLIPRRRCGGHRRRDAVSGCVLRHVLVRRLGAR